jgi:hypothetical protein
MPFSALPSPTVPLELTWRGELALRRALAARRLYYANGGAARDGWTSAEVKHAERVLAQAEERVLADAAVTLDEAVELLQTVDFRIGQYREARGDKSALIDELGPIQSSLREAVDRLAFAHD